MDLRQEPLKQTHAIQPHTPLPPQPQRPLQVLSDSRDPSAHQAIREFEPTQVDESATPRLIDDTDS